MASEVARGMNFVNAVPDLGDEPISAAAYVDPDQFEQEREKIFKRAWLRVCRSDELPEPGDYRVIEMPTWKVSVIVARTIGGQLSAFLNICTHRGMALSLCERGNTTNFFCGYHGWTFNLDGSLRSVPGEEYFPGLEKDKLGARQVSVDEWWGFVFLNWDPSPAISLKQHLGELGEYVEQHSYDDYEHTGRYRLKIDANWKAVTDAFLEPYHVATVHRRSLPDSMNAPGNPMGFPNSCRTYGHHRTMAVWANPAHQPSPTEMLMWKYGFALHPGEVEEIKGANPDRSATWWFDTNIWFPYYTIFIGNGWYLTYDVWPISVNETLWEINTYGMKAQNAGQKLGGDYMKVVLRDAVLEDFSTVEYVQRNLESGGLPVMTISEEMEFYVRHQHWAVREWLDKV